MPKYLVYEIATVSYLVGEYDANTKEGAESMAIDDPQNDQPCLCHQCAGELELGEFYEFQTEEVT